MIGSFFASACDSNNLIFLNYKRRSHTRNRKEVEKFRSFFILKGLLIYHINYNLSKINCPLMSFTWKSIPYNCCCWLPFVLSDNGVCVIVSVSCGVAVPVVTAWYRPIMERPTPASCNSCKQSPRLALRVMMLPSTSALSFYLPLLLSHSLAPQHVYLHGLSPASAMGSSGLPTCQDDAACL